MLLFLLGLLAGLLLRKFAASEPLADAFAITAEAARRQFLHARSASRRRRVELRATAATSAAALPVAQP